MIELKTDCARCIHQKVCKHDGNPKWIRNKLAEMTFGDGLNDDYEWGTMTDAYGVKIEVSCKNFSSGTYLTR